MTKTPFDNLPPAQQAGMLCNDRQFQTFVGDQLDLNTWVTPLACAEYIKRQCRVQSRKDLNTSEAAATRFAAIRTDFDAARGKLPTPR